MQDIAFQTPKQICGLAGVFTGVGFIAKGGRRPQKSDCGFIPGPVDITCDEGRIVSVEKKKVASVQQGSFDATGLYATCGFIDSHTHTLFAGSRGDEHFARWAGDHYQCIAAKGGGIYCSINSTQLATDEYLIGKCNSTLNDMLCKGVTVVEIKTGYAGNATEELRLLELLALINTNGKMSKIIPTCLALHALPPKIPEDVYLKQMIGLLDIITERELATFVDAFPENGFFSNATVESFYKSAQKRGLSFKVHCDQLSDKGSALQFTDMGATSIDHLENMNPAAIKFLATTETVATVLPTVSLYLNLQYANARSLIDAGCIVAIASDFNPGSSPQIGLQLPTLLAASQMKMSPAEILCGVTYNAAKALNLTKQYGVVSKDMIADILLWESEAKADANGISILEELFSSSKEPSIVVSKGRVVHSK